MKESQELISRPRLTLTKATTLCSGLEIVVRDEERLFVLLPGIIEKLIVPTTDAEFKSQSVLAQYIDVNCR